MWENLPYCLEKATKKSFYRNRAGGGKFWIQHPAGSCLCCSSGWGITTVFPAVQRAVAAPLWPQHPAGSTGNAAKTPSVSSQLPMGETASGDQENCRAAFLQQHSLPSSESEDDDGFLELLDDQDLKVCAEGRGWRSPNQLCLMCLVCSGCSNCWVFGNSRIPDWIVRDLKATSNPLP